MGDLKSELYAFCEEKVAARVALIKSQISAIQESLNSETKSSAGDKHETGRAMMQLEREKLGVRLLEAEKSKRDLRKVPIDKLSENVSLGSLVHTSTNSYFLAISSGAFIKNKKRIFCISPGTPVGKVLLGKSEGDQCYFNNMAFKIEEVL